MGIQREITCEGGGLVTAGIYDVCSSTLPDVFALLLSLLFFFNVKLRPLELHIYICGISRVRLISNLMYPYAFVFLPLLPSIFFNLDYSSKTVSFSSII